jgi:hypothetical protein
MTILNSTRLLRYVELIGTTVHNVTNPNVWEDWDLSLLIPVGAVAVEIRIENAQNYPGGVRTNGSALVRYVSNSDTDNLCVMVGVGIDRIIEVYSGTNDERDFYLEGYWI